MKPTIEKLHNTWTGNQKGEKQTDLGQLSIEEIVNSIFTAGPSYYYIIDFFNMKLSHVSPAIREIHGLDPETVTFDDILNRIHPGDIEYVSKTEAKLNDIFTSDLGRDKFMQNKLSFCCRLKSVDGSYKLFLRQCLVLTIDNKGGIGKSLNIHTDISDITSVNNYKISISSLEGGTAYTNIDVYETLHRPNNYTSYSKRETQLLKLLGEGMTNQEISTALNIALDTAKNHRRNILKKAQVKNTPELIKKSIQEGLI